MIQRIGLFGGTFDPIHTAHLSMARAAMEVASLDTVLFVVAAIPPHKQRATHAAAEDRLAMVERAVEDEAGFEASGIELEREGPSYTADTLRVLHDRHPGSEFFMIIGEDSLADFPKWRESEVILEHAHLLVLPRPKTTTPIDDSLAGQYTMVPFEMSALSSTEVRKALRQQQDVGAMLPGSVSAFIDARGLYETKFTTPRAEEYLVLLAERLPDKTLRHVRSVATFMLSIAQEAGITSEQAVTAGLLHDLCKADTHDVLRAKALSFGMREHLDNPNLLHGPVAAAECRADLGIEDDNVLEAIAYHTTAKGDWNPVGRALYLADFSEPLREHPKAQHARELLAHEGYFSALLYVAQTRLAHVRETFGGNEDTEAFVHDLEKKN